MASSERTRLRAAAHEEGALRPTSGEEPRGKRRARGRAQIAPRAPAVLEGTVLLIGSDRDMLGLWRDVLNEEGFRTAAVHFEPQFTRYINALRPALILCDEVFPDIDGERLFLALQHSPDLARTPFMLLADRVDGERVARCLDAGMVEFLSKPFDVAELSARIRKAMRQREGQATPVLDEESEAEVLNGFRGSLAVIGLPDLLLNLHQNARTGELRLHLDGADFRIHFERGAIVRADGGGVVGRKALHRAIRTSQQGNFTFDASMAVQADGARFDNIANLVLSAVQEADEYPLSHDRLPARVRVSVERQASEAVEEDAALLGPLIEDPGRPVSVEALIDACAATDLQAAQRLLELLEKRVLVSC